MQSNLTNNSTLNSNAATNVSKPPAFPKASRNNQLYIHRQRQLKDRLKLKWGNSNPPSFESMNDEGEINPKNNSPSPPGTLVKGYGENQFNDSVMDSQLSPNRNYPPSSLFETEESKVLTNNKVDLRSGSVHKTYLTALPSHYDTSTGLDYSSQQQQQSIMTTEEERFQELSSHPSHLEMSQSLLHDGYEGVVDNLVDGRTDFCYLQPDEQNFYRFGIKTNFPSYHSTEYDHFTTLSARGMLRFLPDGSELSSFETVGKEKIIYDSLLKFRIFKNFWMIKTFAAWKKFIINRRMERLNKIISKELIVLDPICRDLLLSSRKILEDLTKEKIFILDGANTIPFHEFVKSQKNKNLFWKNRIQKSVLEIVGLLCKRCEDYVFEAASIAPPSVAVKQFNQIKVGRTMQYSQLIDIIQPDRSVSHQVTSAVEEMKNTKEMSSPSSSGKKKKSQKDSIPKYKQEQQQQQKHQQQRQKKQKKAANFFHYSSDEYDEQIAIEAAAKQNETLSPRDILADLAFNAPLNVPFSVRAAIRLRCRRLISLFRLVDYMLRDRLYEFLFSCLTELDLLLRNFGNIPYNSKESSLIEETTTSVQEDESMDDNNQATKRGILQIDIVYIPDEIAETNITTTVTISDNAVTEANRIRTNSEQITTTASAEFSSFIREINFYPNKIHCLEEIRNLLIEICTYCSYTNGLLTNERCYKIFTPIHSEIAIHELDDRIFLDNEQNQIQSVVKGLLQYLAVQCDIVYHDIQTLDIFREQLNENRQYYRLAAQTKLLDQSPEIILQHLNKWDTEIFRSSCIKYTQRIGIFQCELKTIKTDFISLITTNQQLYYRLIPDLYVTHGDEFYRDISHHIDKMMFKFHNLEEFIKVLESYQYCFDIETSVLNKFKYIMNIREIVESHEQIRISDAILRQNLTLTNTFHKFNSLLSEYEDVLENQIKIYRPEMVARYKKIILPIQEFKSYIDEINSFMIQEDYQPNAEEILIQLYSYKKQMEVVSQQLLQLDSYQKILKIIIFEKGVEIEMEDELKSNIFLWQSWKTLDELTHSFLSIGYLDANCDAVHKEVLIVKSELNANNYFSLINETINQSMNITGEEGQANLTLDNEIGSAKRGVYKCFHKILTMASSLLEIVPIIKKLQSNTFKAEHIESIHAFLHRPIYDDVDITVKELIDDIHIKDYADWIEDIYSQSKIQFYLELKVNNYYKLLETIEFTFLNDIDNKALIFINNFIEIQDQLQDILLSLQSIASSQSIHAIYQTVHDLIVEVSQWIEAISYFQIFQQKYLQYRTLFTSAKTARQLSPYMKYFKLIDENWRTLIRLSKLSLSIQKFFEEKQVYQILQTVTQSTIGNIEKGIMDIIDDQCEKYSKFYFIDRQTMIELLTNNSLHEILYLLSTFCFPYLITNIETDPHENYNIIAIYCKEEKITFQKAISGRSNLADFCKSIEHMIHDRLERDIKELIIDDYNNTTATAGNNNNQTNNNSNNKSNTNNAFFNMMNNLNSSSNRQLLEDLRTGKFCEQSQILMLQIKFWSSLEKIYSTSSFGKYSLNRVTVYRPAPAGGGTAGYERGTLVVDEEEEEQTEEIKRNLYFNLRALLLELTDQIAIISSILTDINNSLVTKKVSNIIITIIYFRDLVRSMIEDETGSLPDKAAGGKEGSANDINQAEQQYFVKSDKIFYSLQKKVLFHNGIQYGTYPYYSANQLQLGGAAMPADPNFQVHVPATASTAFAMQGATISSAMAQVNPTPLNPAHYAGPVIIVEQGGLLERYGMKYQGFSSRLVMMPLVDKCFFALNQAFRYKHSDFFRNTGSSSFNVPILQAQYPKSLIIGLAYEYGSDIVVMNVNQSSFLRFANSIEYLTKSIIVAFRLNLFLVFNHAELWTTEMLSYYGNLLSAVHETLFLQRQEVKFPFETSASSMSMASVPQNHPTHSSGNKSTSTGPTIMKKTVTLTPQPFPILPKICFLHSIALPNRFSEVYHTNRLFIPIHAPPLPTKILLRTFLTSYNFVFVNKITARLESLIDYLINAHIAERSLILKLFLQSIRSVGIENEHSRINVSMQLNLIVKRFFSLLPLSIQCRISESEIRLICNLFLEIIYNPENDKKDFYSFIPPLEHAIFLKKMLIPGLYYGNNQQYYSFPAGGAAAAAAGISGDGASVSSGGANNDEDRDSLLRRYQERNLILIVGASNIGKTTLIRNASTSLQQDLTLRNNAVLNNPGHGSTGEENVLQLLPTICFYYTPFNPIVLLGSSNLDVVIAEEGVDGTTVSSQFNRVFQKILERQLSSIYQSSHIHFFFHIDLSSSYHLALLIEDTIQYLKKFYPHREVKLIFEMTELIDICPASLTKVNLVSIHDPLYTLEEVFVKSFKYYTDNTSHYYQKAVAEIRDAIIRPCVINYPQDSIVSQFILARQIFALFSDLFHLLIFPISQGSTAVLAYDIVTTTIATSSGSPTKSKEGKKALANYNDFDEDTLRRIGVFCCIWTVGVCSPTSRFSFEKWFRDFFYDEITNTRGRKIFPVFDSSSSIFKYNLHRIEGTIPSLEWVQYDSKVLSSVQLTKPTRGALSATQNLLSSTGLYSLNQHELLVVNSEMKALAHIQAAISHTVYHQLNSKNLGLTAKQRRSNGIHLFGESSTGKKTILHYLLQQLSYFSKSASHGHQKGGGGQSSASSIECCRRWVLHAKNNNDQLYHTSTLQRELLQSKQQLSTYLHEHNLPDYGALFIEDINVDNPGSLSWKAYSSSPDQIISQISEVIRQITEFHTIYDENYQQFATTPMFYTVINSISDRNSCHSQQKAYFQSNYSFNNKTAAKPSAGGVGVGNITNLSLGVSAGNSNEEKPTEEKSEDDGSNSYHGNSRNERLLKHFLSFYCSTENVKDVFAIILHKQYVNLNMTLELAKDITSLTHNYFQQLQKLIYDLQQYGPSTGISSVVGAVTTNSGAITSLSSRSPFFTFRENEKLLLYSLSCQPALLWTQSILMKLSQALSYLQYHSITVSLNDILRIWDRITNDINHRFPLVERMTDLFSLAFEEAMNTASSYNYYYSSPSFVSILERERSIRLSNLDNVLSSFSAPQVDEAISYTRNCMGFFKTVVAPAEAGSVAAPSVNASSSMLMGRKSITASTLVNAIGSYPLLPALISPIVSTSEFLREIIFKQIMERNLLLRSASLEIDDSMTKLNRLAIIEDTYRRNKSSISFWMDAFKLLNLISLSFTGASQSPSVEGTLLLPQKTDFPSNKSIIVIVNSTHSLWRSQLERIQMIAFHLNCELRKIPIDGEVIENYLFTTTNSSFIHFDQSLRLSALENFFRDEYVIHCLQKFVKKTAARKIPLSSVGGSRKASANAAIVTPQQIQQLLEKARAVTANPVLSGMSGNSTRRQSRVTANSEIVPFSMNHLLTSMQLSDFHEKYRKRLEALVEYIQNQLFSPHSYESMDLEDDNPSHRARCASTLWILKVDSKVSYAVNQEMSYNPFLNPSLLVKMIRDLSMFESSSMIQSFFSDFIHEEFQLSFHEELRRLLFDYSTQQRFIVSVHEGNINPVGNTQNIHSLPSELYSSLLSDFPGLVHIYDTFPEKLPKSDQQETTQKTKDKQLTAGGEEVKKSSPEPGNNRKSIRPKAVTKSDDGSYFSRQLIQDYLHSLNQFIEKNKLVMKKYALNSALVHQHSRHLHKLLFETTPENTMKGVASSDKVTVRESVEGIKRFSEELFSKIALSGYSQELIYSHHNNCVALNHLDEYHLISLLLMAVYSKAVVAKSAQADDLYVPLTNIPSLVEFLMKRDVLSLSANTSSEENQNEGDSSGRSVMTAPQLFIPYFQLFLSNLQMVAVAYLIHQILLSSSYAYLDQSFLPTNYQQSVSHRKQCLLFYSKFWKFYQLAPRNSQLKHYFPSLLTSYYLYGKIVIEDSLIFTTLFLNTLLQTEETSSTKTFNEVQSSYHVENGKLLTEIKSSFCISTFYEAEPSPTFEISRLDIPLLSEMMLLLLLSQNLLDKVHPELSLLFGKLKNIVSSQWQVVKQLIIPVAHQQRNVTQSTAEEEDEDELEEENEGKDHKENYDQLLSLNSFIFDEMMRYEELFHEITSTMTQGLEMLFLLLRNLLQTSSSSITSEKLILAFGEFWRIVVEQMEYGHSYQEIEGQIAAKKQQKSEKPIDSTSTAMKRSHPVFGQPSSIINFAVLKFAVEILPHYLTSEGEFHYLLFETITDAFFSTYSNQTHENMASFYKHRYLLQFHQLAHLSSYAISASPPPPNGVAPISHPSKTAANGNVASHAHNTVTDPIPFVGLKESNPRLYALLTHQQVRLDWKYGIIHKEQLNTPKLTKLVSQMKNLTINTASEKEKNNKNNPSGTNTNNSNNNSNNNNNINLKTITEDNISDLGSGSENGDPDNPVDDNYILEENHLSELSKHLLKQSFTIINQFLNTGVIGTFYARYHASAISSSSSSASKDMTNTTNTTAKSENYYLQRKLKKYSPQHNPNLHSHHTNLALITLIEKNLDEIMDWVSNIALPLEALYENYHVFLTPLEEMIFVAVMKPILFPQILLNHFYLFGLNLNFRSFDEIQSILFQQQLLRRYKERLSRKNSGDKKLTSSLSIEYGNFNDYRLVFSNPYLQPNHSFSLIDRFHYRLLYNYEKKDKMIHESVQNEQEKDRKHSVGARKDSAATAGSYSNHPKSGMAGDDSSVMSNESNDRSAVLTISSDHHKRKQSSVGSKKSLYSVAETGVRSITSLSVPRQYFPFQLLEFLKHQFHHLERDWIRSLTSPRDTLNSERVLHLQLMGNCLSTNATVILPHYLTNSHNMSGWNRILQSFPSSALTELAQRMTNRNWKLLVSIPSKTYHSFFPEQYIYIDKKAVLTQQPLPITSDFLGNYNYAFSVHFFLLLLSSLISNVSFRREEVLQISPSKEPSATPAVVVSRYSKLFSFIQQQYTHTTSSASSGINTAAATGTSSLLLLLQTMASASAHSHIASTLPQIYEAYADVLLLLFSRIRYLLVLSHLSFLYYYRFISSLCAVGSATSNLINNYPNHSSLLGLLCSPELIVQAIEMIENIFLQQLMLTIEYEIKRYHDYQKYIQQTNNNPSLAILNFPNSFGYTNAFIPKKPNELIQQSLLFITEKKVIHSLLYNLYYSKFSSLLPMYSIKDYHFLKMILESFFTSAAMNYQYHYLLLNQVQVPKNFDSSEIESFFGKMKQLFDDNMAEFGNHSDKEENSEDEEEEEEDEMNEEDDEEEEAVLQKDGNEEEGSGKGTEGTGDDPASSVIKQQKIVSSLLRIPRGQKFILNQQNENLICDLLFLNPNFLFTKYFYLIQRISQESYYQTIVQQFIDSYHYDEAVSPHSVVPYSTNNNNSNNTVLTAGGNTKSPENTTSNSASSSRPNTSAAPNTSNAGAPSAHKLMHTSRTNYYYQILQTKSFCSNHFFLLVQQSLHSFYRKLRSIEKISWKKSPEAMKQMKEHSFTENNMKHKGGGSVAGSVNSGSGAAAAAGNTNFRRRFGQRIILRFQSREYDPLWAFLLLEIYQFNKYYSTVMKYFASFIQYYSSADQWMKYFEQYFLQHPLIYHHHLQLQQQQQQQQQQSSYQQQQQHSAVNNNSTSFSSSSSSNSSTTAEMLIQQQSDLIHSLYVNCMIQLSQQCIPSIWLHYQDSIFTSLPNCSMDHWSDTIIDQREMLWQWLVEGKPSNISLYLLHNPAGLFYALKETFALRAESVVDKVFFHCEVIPLLIHQQEQIYYYSQQQEQLQQQQMIQSIVQPTMSPTSPRKTRKQQSSPTNAAASTNPTSSSIAAAIEAANVASLFVVNSDQSYLTTSLGCYLHLTNVAFLNALFSARTNMMEFMPLHAISPFGSEVVIRVYASLEEQSLWQDDTFNCPMFIPSNYYHPIYILSNAIQFPPNRNQPVQGNAVAFPSSTETARPIYQQDNPAVSAFERMGLTEEERSEKQPILLLPVNTLEDPEDCQLNRISLISCPPWLVPLS